MANDAAPRTAVNQSPGGGTDYPFLRDCDLSGSILDVYVHCAPGFKLPFRVDFFNDGGELGFDLSDADLMVVTAVSTGTGQNTTTTWGDRTVLMWVGEDFVFRVVLAASPEYGNGILDPRTYHPRLDAVSAIEVNGEALTGDVAIRHGYNTSVVANNVIGISAVPGSGLGRSPGCQDPTPLLRQINRVPADANRNFTLSFDPCFRTRRPLAFSGGALPTASFADDVDAHTLQVSDDCRPCMTCDDVVRTYKGLRRVWDRWKAAAAAAEGVRDQYAANRERWLAARACRLAQPSTLVTSPDTACKAFAGGAFCNMTTCCIRNVELRFTLQKYAGGAPAAWAGGGVSKATRNDVAYSPLVSGQVVRFFFDYVDPNQSAVATFKYLSAGCLPGNALVVTMTTHADEPGNDPNGELCTLPSASVPGDIAAIWTAYGVPLTAARTLQTRAVGVSP